MSLDLRPAPLFPEGAGLRYHAKHTGASTPRKELFLSLLGGALESRRDHRKRVSSRPMNANSACIYIYICEYNADTYTVYMHTAIVGTC